MERWRISTGVATLSGWLIGLQLLGCLNSAMTASWPPLLVQGLMMVVILGGLWWPLAFSWDLRPRAAWAVFVLPWGLACAMTVLSFALGSHGRYLSLAFNFGPAIVVAASQWADWRKAGLR